MNSISTPYQPISTLRSTWIIAYRQLRSIIFARRSVVWLFVTISLIYTTRSFMDSIFTDPTMQGMKGTIIAIWLVLPIWISGQATGTTAIIAFSGDKERGSLLPLLATPASNIAIFAGKIFGCIIPALLYALICTILYLAYIIFSYGVGILAIIPWNIAAFVTILALGMMMLAATISSIISSRVKTFQTAQSIASLITLPLNIGVGFGVYELVKFGTWAYPVSDILVIVVNILVIILAATTWKREEIMANI